MTTTLFRATIVFFLVTIVSINVGCGDDRKNKVRDGINADIPPKPTDGTTTPGTEGATAAALTGEDLQKYDDIMKKIDDLVHSGSDLNKTDIPAGKYQIDSVATSIEYMKDQDQFAALATTGITTSEVGSDQIEFKLGETASEFVGSIADEERKVVLPLAFDLNDDKLISDENLTEVTFKTLFDASQNQIQNTMESTVTQIDSDFASIKELLNSDEFNAASSSFERPAEGDLKKLNLNILSSSESDKIILVLTIHESEPTSEDATLKVRRLVITYKRVGNVAADAGSDADTAGEENSADAGSSESSDESAETTAPEADETVDSSTENT